MGETREIKYDYTRFVIPIGPVHPALKEPVHFRVSVRREEIVDVDVRLGFNYRGIELMAEKLNLVQAIPLIARICGICPACHTICFTQALENIGEVEAPERAMYLRALIAEMERLHSHLLWAGIAAYEVGFDTLFMHIWQKREKVLDLFEMLTGSRLKYAIDTIGGVRWDITPTMREKILEKMKGLERETRHIADIFLSDKTIESRFEGVGHLSREEAQKLGVVGPTARGSNVDIDVRRDDPYIAYNDLMDKFSVILRKNGDVLARTEVRLLEMLQSINLIKATLDGLPNGSAAQKHGAFALMRKVPAGEAVARVEAPRGENIHHLQTSGQGGITKLKVRTPTLVNVTCLRHLLVGGEVADIPIAIASIDPCISCADRVAIVDEVSGNETVVDLEKVRDVNRRKTRACLK